MTEQLSQNQEHLVAEHLGLVKTVVKRVLAYNRHHGHVDDRDDLFQEGCLGLIRAARDYDPQHPTSFEIFAGKRIHNVINRALSETSKLVRVPNKERRNKYDPHTPHDIRVEPLKSEPGCVPTHHAKRPIASRVRRSIERAARLAGDHLQNQGRRRQGRQALIERVIGDRLMVPDEHQRTPLRELAREVSCSYTRVAHCEDTLLSRMREILQDDCEFTFLIEQARRQQHGLDSDITDISDQALTTWYGRLLERVPPNVRQQLLWLLLCECQGQPDVLLERLFDKLNAKRKWSMLNYVVSQVYKP